MKDYSNYYPSYQDMLLNSGKIIFEQQLLGTEGKDILIDNSIETKALVKYHQNPLNEFKEDRKITFRCEEIVRRGSLIKTIEDGHIFLVISAINENELVKYALMRQTNKTIKWINKNNILIEKPSITTSQTLYTTGIKDEKIIQVPDGMTGILLPFDSDTKELKRGDAFVFNKAKYMVSHYNEVDRPGVLALICKEENINYARDDAENEIANRWDENKNDRLGEDIKPPDPPEGALVYSTIGNDKLRNGQTGTYTISKTIDGVELGGTFAFSIDNEALATIIETNNNTCKVKASTQQTGEVILTITDLDTDTQTNKIIQVIPFM